MDCPYCKNTMTKGYIPIDRYNLKWINEKDYTSSPLDFFKKGIKLTSLSKSSALLAFYCDKCNKMIVSLDESE